MTQRKRNTKKKQNGKKAQPGQQLVQKVIVPGEEKVMVVLLGHGEILVGGFEKKTSAAMTITYPAFMALIPVPQEIPGGDDQSEEQSMPQTEVHMLRPVPAVVAKLEEAYATLRVPSSRILSAYEGNRNIVNIWQNYRAQTIQMINDMQKLRDSLIVDPSTIGSDDDEIEAPVAEAAEAPAVEAEAPAVEAVEAEETPTEAPAVEAVEAPAVTPVEGAEKEAYDDAVELDDQPEASDEAPVGQGEESDESS